MPQMMPCSWLMIFTGSVSLFLLLNSNWSSFFFLTSFPKGVLRFSSLKKTFWCK
uniref:ATP synthase F0 subunit 8 n=1 Tax=Brueelia antiqua TaxID=580326 RepID=UPI00211E1E86|nr:ATP synthase F0 subunit 8 [Brueelia antiqua]UTT72550.1 ATP synthase F0 subunit 8 [Brueelia antiqua]